MSVALRPVSLKRGKSKPISAYRMVAEKLVMRLTRSISVGSVTFVLEDETEIPSDSGNPGPAAVIKVHSLKGIRRLISSGYVGLAEGYMAGDWSTPSLRDIFDFGTANMKQLDENLSGGAVARFANAMSHFHRRNNKSGSRRNIADHYDLGNDFFGKWLDKTMTYSSALFKDTETESLAQAQENKFRRIVERLGLTSDQHVVEIGCGWGGFAEFAAKETGAKVTGITISREQQAFATARMKKNGLSDQVDIRLQDYRDLNGKFDHAVSIEMLEAVGESYWPSYFQTISRNLKRGGKAMIQVIVVPDDRFAQYKQSVDFIQKYIFPGGMLLSPGHMKSQSAGAGLALEEAHTFGSDYSRTLDLWRETFDLQWPSILPLGFDERFKRMWDYYLEYTSAGFRAGSINVGQFLLKKV